MRNEWRDQVILVAVCAGAYFFQLGATHLWEEDEAYFGRTAQEMYERGDYIVPWFNGDISLHKPILMYWVMIGGFQLFGTTEFAARCGSAIFGIGNVLLTYQLGRRLFSERVGFWSGVVLGTCLHFAVVSRAAVADPELICFCTLPMLIFAWGTPLSRSRMPAVNNAAASISATDLPRSRWMFVYASMAVAALAKGPVGIVLPTAVIGLFLLLMRIESRIESPSEASARWLVRVATWLAHLFWPPAVWRTAWQMRPITAAAMIGLVALPWYLAVGWMTAGAWLQGFFLVHNYGRFMNSFESHGGGPLYYLAAVAIGMFPWCIFGYQGAYLTATGLQRGNPSRTAYLFLCAWVAVWVGAFTCAGTKLPHYVLPAYPALAIIIGGFLEQWLAGTDGISHRWHRTSWAVLIMVGLGMLVSLPLVARTYLSGEEQLGLIGLIPAVAGMIGFWAVEHGRRMWAAGAVSVGAVAFLVVLLGWGAVRVDQYQSSPLVAKWLRELAPDHSAELGAHGCFEASLLYYCDQNIAKLGRHESVASFFADHPQATFLLTTDRKLARTGELLPAGVQIVRETPRFLKHERLLLLGRANHDVETHDRHASSVQWIQHEVESAP